MLGLPTSTPAGLPADDVRLSCMGDPADVRKISSALLSRGSEAVRVRVPQPSVPAPLRP